jgi:hypothetical protein
MQKALIHIYDNKADILEVEKRCCSEVYRRSTDDAFDIVIVVPTGTAGAKPSPFLKKRDAIRTSSVATT